MWFKRLIDSLSGYQNKARLENDIKTILNNKNNYSYLFSINITFIGLIFFITRFFIN